MSWSSEPNHRPARRLRIRARAVTIVTCCLTLSCIGRSIPKPQTVHPGPSPDSPHIIVLKSSDNRILNAPMTTFVEQANAKVTIFSGIPKKPKALLTEVKKLKPSLLFVLGTRATLFATKNLPDVPTIFTMVVNYKRHDLGDHANVMGIALEISPASEFSQFKMVAPQLRRVLAFYVESESKGLVDEARLELAKLGLELVAVPVTSPEQVTTLFDSYEKTIDGIWLLNDPVVMNKQTFKFLRDKALKGRIPFVSSLSDKFATGGALMSVSTDLNALGTQAAAMARMHLEQKTPPRSIGIQPPISSNLVVNMAVAKRIGVVVADEILPYISPVGEPSRVASPQ